MKTRNLARTGLFAISMALMLGGAAFAQTTTGNMTVSSDITNNCALSEINPLAFGAYDPVNANSSTALHVTTSFGLTCTDGDSSVVIGLTLGANADASQRYMVDSNNDKLAYNLYSDAAYSTAWDTTTTVSDTGTGSLQTFKVYGSIPAGQATIPAGSYSDTVGINVAY